MEAPYCQPPAWVSASNFRSVRSRSDSRAAKPSDTCLSGITRGLLTRSKTNSPQQELSVKVHSEWPFLLFELLGLPLCRCSTLPHIGDLPSAERIDCTGLFNSVADAEVH